MKRFLIVALLATALLVAFTAPAFASDYRLTITCYFDADSDSCWDVDEQILPNVVGWIWTAEGRAPDFKTDACGRAKSWWPYGTVVYAKPVSINPWPYDLLPNGFAYTTEHTPDAPEYPTVNVAKVVMRGNRCMLFGVGPQPPAPPCSPCAPLACEPD